MVSEVIELAIEIVRFVDDYQPGIVQCEFVDADGRRHTFVEKVPIVSLEDLNASSEYPRGGSARCRIRSRWRDANGRDLVTVSTAEPFGIESTEGLSEFVVLEAQLSTHPTSAP